MPYFSNLQQLLTGLMLSYSGYGLAFQPHQFRLRLAPFLRLFTETDIPAVHLESSTAFTSLAGVSLLSLGYFYLWSIYTQDEKFKRNSVPGRFIIAFLSYYLATIENDSTSSLSSALLNLFAIFNLATGFSMGLSIGFQDGNQVDIDEAEKRRQKEKQWRVRERELLEEIRKLETATKE
ncbi:uncharacterized protein JCM6883_005184 [Sporobolomyces salmoneus]|uniref:uncharacterized protein n=1 Tax=Sporobolomyces salmoneus TaxID=183962 RepID=UPI00317A1AA5